ncbi:MAG: hypothetical protein M1828_007145 [Chrysothrix sp. TS-e1954]|nr:MAG: hypothetical protein M1828_007145 [Chrysothrix sp. TS-e1954]
MYLPCSLSLLRIALIYLVARLTVADPPAFYQSQAYETGELGWYPELSFHSTELRAPQLNIRTWEAECDTDEYFFLAPRGLLVGPLGPVILDSHGHMMWHREDFGNVYGLTVQKYRGEDVLTFWSGDDEVVGHGSGFNYMFDSHYRQLYKVSAAHGLTADLHEFKITKDNTALLTSYQQLPADLSSLGREEPGFIWDSIFQEIDIETDTVLFEWHALDHFTFDDCYNVLIGKGAEDDAFDYYHINSIDKDPKGNYIISARYSHAVSYIDGHTGDVLWHLGGKNNSFHDLSDGKATSFAWQHDARWLDDYATITIFDNAAWFGDDKRPARAMKVRLDTVQMTAELVAEYIHPDEYISESQGSMQVLDSGDVFVGYGSAPAFTEFSADGRVLCDAHFGALAAGEDGAPSPGAVMSYRTYKHPWVGKPLEDPKVKFEEGVFYVSWNGATEVRHWLLEGSTRSIFNTGAEAWTTIGSIPWAGFESSINVETGVTDATAHLTYRLTATDSNHRIIGAWGVNTGGFVHALETTVHSRWIPLARFVVFVLASIGALTLIASFWRRSPSFMAVWMHPRPAQYQPVPKMAP